MKVDIKKYYILQDPDKKEMFAVIGRFIYVEMEDACIKVLILAHKREVIFSPSRYHKDVLKLYLSS